MKSVRSILMVLVAFNFLIGSQTYGDDLVEALGAATANLKEKKRSLNPSISQIRKKAEPHRVTYSKKVLEARKALKLKVKNVREKRGTATKHVETKKRRIQELKQSIQSRSSAGAVDTVEIKRIQRRLSESFDPGYDENDYLGYDGEHWYEVWVPDGIINPSILIWLDFDHYDGDIDLELYDDFNWQLESSVGVTDSEFIEKDVDGGEYYHIRVYTVGDWAGDYTLSWDYDHDGFLEDLYFDPYEANDSRYSSYDLTYNDGRWLSDIAGEAIVEDGWDEDWYEIEVNESNADLEISLDTNSFTMRVTLYNEFGSFITSDDSEIFVTGLDRGTYYLMVEDIFANQDSYDLYWDWDYSYVYEDDYEYNNDLSSAYDLSGWEGLLLSDVSGKGALQDEDWFEVYVTEENTLLILDLYFTHSHGNLDMEVYDEDGEFVAGKQSHNDNEYMDLMLPYGGRYYVRVYGYSSSVYSSSPTYDLRWQTARTAPWFDQDTLEFHVPFVQLEPGHFPSSLSADYYSLKFRYYGNNDIRLVEAAVAITTQQTQNRYYDDSWLEISNGRILGHFRYFTIDYDGDPFFLVLKTVQHGDSYFIDSFGPY